MQGREPDESRCGPASGASAETDALRLRIAELTEAVAARDAFLAIAAHELRNPMTPILGEVQRLMRLVANRACTIEDVERSLGRLQGGIDHYLKRATTLLDVSRITSGKLRLEPEPTDISGLIRQLAATHQSSAEYARCVLNADIQDGVDGIVDRLALEQVVDNLLLNAMKYGAGNPVDLGFAADPARLTVTVRDRGIGISPEAKARIFERFERAVHSANQPGFGVGLWVVRQLVDAMGGDIAVDAVPEGGTIFMVTIPRVTREAT